MHGAPGAEKKQPAGPEDEPLVKMSVGDHLDELRRRLLICLGSVGVCVLVMVFFKSWVTSVYIQPYRIAWKMAYVDYLEFRDQQFREAVQKTMPPERYRMFRFVEENAEAVRAGAFQPRERIAFAGHNGHIGLVERLKGAAAQVDARAGGLVRISRPGGRLPP